MHKIILFLIVAGLLNTSCSEDSTAGRVGLEIGSKQSLPDVLVAGRWQFVISEGLPSQETKTYKFLDDGRYEFVLQSDFQYYDSGTWKLTNQDDGHFLLELAKTSDEAGAHFLFSSSQIEYDHKTDRLLVMGPNYADNAHMRHLEK